MPDHPDDQDIGDEVDPDAPARGVVDDDDADPPEPSEPG